MDRPAARGVRRRLRDDRGQVFVFLIGGLAAFIMLVALAVDGGYAFWAKRSLQASADAAALAAAQELPHAGNAVTVGYSYSGNEGTNGFPQGSNYSEPLETDTDVSTACVGGGQCPDRVIVEERATVPTFFARVFGINSYVVTARAVASRGSTTAGTPLAIFVHERCGASTGDKGLIINGANARVEGGLHVNGHFELGGTNFRVGGPATLYRPPNQGTSPNDPAHPQGSGCKNPNRSDDAYCADCPGGPEPSPTHGPWRDWATPYHTELIAKGFVGACTHSPSSDVSLTNASWSGARVYCLANDKKFSLSGTASAPDGSPLQLTVFAGLIEVGGNGKLTPANANHPILFYSTNPSLGTEVKLNPSGAYDWNGYIINRKGGIVVNASGVTSPQDGLLEAEWIQVNGENFTMLGQFADSSSGGLFGAVTLDE